MMTHTEGVIKSFEVSDDNLIITFVPYGESVPMTIGVSVNELLKRILKNEKIGVVQYEEHGSDDTVDIRGVVKGLTLFATYSN